jgi:hypothetical protein
MYLMYSRFCIVARPAAVPKVRFAWRLLLVCFVTVCILNTLPGYGVDLGLGHAAFVLGPLLMMGFFGSWFFMIVRVVKEMRLVVRNASTRAQELPVDSAARCKILHAAQITRWSYRLTIASNVSSIVNAVVKIFEGSARNEMILSGSSAPTMMLIIMISEFVFLLDMAFNNVCAAYLAGYYNRGSAIEGGTVTVEEALKNLRERQVHDALCDAAKAVSCVRSGR